MIGQFPWDPFPENVALPEGPDPIHVYAYQAAVTAADAYRGVREALRVEHDLLRIGNRFVPLDRYREVAFASLGVAAGSMALGAVDSLGEYLTAGFAAGPAGSMEKVPFHRIEVPLEPPGTPRAEEVVRATTEIAESLGDERLFVLLLSPGSTSALALPPPGMTAADLRGLCEEARRRGASGRELALLVRVVARGGVGGAIARIAGSADVATFVVDRGDGARLAGGGPVHPISADERAQVRALLERIELASSVPAPVRDTVSAGGGPTGRAQRPVHLPVYVARPTDALTGAGDALFDRKWRVRLGMIDLPGTPEAAADAFLQRVEEVLAKEPPAAADKSHGIAVMAMSGLDQPEGSDDGPAVGRFLQQAERLLRRKDLSVGLYRTSGPVGSSAFPPGAVVGAPMNSKFESHRGRARGIPMEAGVTDVGALAVALLPAVDPDAESN